MTKEDPANPIKNRRSAKCEAELIRPSIAVGILENTNTAAIGNLISLVRLGIDTQDGTLLLTWDLIAATMELLAMAMLFS